MTTITKERIELFIKNPLENGLTRGEQMELARIALASLEADPVKRVNSDQMRRVCLEANRHLDKYDAMAKEVNKLLGRIAPPAPVVPEEATPENVEMLSGYVSTYKLTDSERDIAAEIWNACRTAMLQAGNFRESKNSSTNNFREIAETSTNYPVIPSEVLSAILKVAKIRADFDDFDGDRRGIGDCLDEAEQELFVTINKYASQLAAEPVAYIFKHPAGKLFWALTDESNKEQSDVIPVYAAPPVPVVPEEKPMPNPLKMYAVDAVAAIAEVRGWNACRAAMLQAEPVSNSDELPLDYLQGHKDGLEWAAQLAEANHPQTGDWLYDDPIDLARAIRKGPDMPTVQAGNYPVTPDGWISCSERMPNTKTAVLVAVEFDRKGDWRMKWATYIPGHPDANDGWIIPGASWKPSHWMPLPEPPQEVK
ncbi:TPA: DUF551 domain-containing protein [Escherichia coli]|nr:DUF551 domain-containing protein [Escherichia coli]